MIKFTWEVWRLMDDTAKAFYKTLSESIGWDSPGLACFCYPLYWAIASRRSPNTIWQRLFRLDIIKIYDHGHQAVPISLRERNSQSRSECIVDKSD